MMLSMIYIVFLCIVCILEYTKCMDFFHRNNFHFKNNNKDSNTGGGSVSDEYYKILGIDSQSTDGEIKKAYRKQAMMMHPDKGGDTEQFKLLTEAYEVLSDPKKKQLYDQYGKDGVSKGHGMQDFSGINNPFGADLSDLFGSFSNSFSMPLMYTIELSLEDLYIGRELNVAVNNQQILINIEPGMYNGIELKGEIKDIRGGTRDIVFVINEKENSVYKRSNGDLYIEVLINLKESLLGFERIITQLDGSKFTIQSKVNEVYAPDDILVIDDMGMPIYNPRSTEVKKGKLYIKILVDFPKKMWLSLEDKEVLDSLLPNDESINTTSHSYSKSSTKDSNAYVNKSSNSKKSKIRNNINGIFIQPNKATLKNFGSSGKPKRTTRSFQSENMGANFGPFFFR